MSWYWALVLLAAVLFAFVSSLSTREPIRVGGRRLEPEMLRLHRSLVVHLGITLCGVVAVVAGARVSLGGLIAFFVLVLLARLLGKRVERIDKTSQRLLAPLMAPIDGAAFFIDWMVSPLVRSRRVDPVEGASSETAYDQVLELTQTTVEQAMTPRSEVDWFAPGATLSEMTETLRRRPHAYYPVFEGDFEQVVGMLCLIDLLKPGIERATAASLARPSVMVPETITCDDLLERMRKDRFDTAIVVDEFGGIAGLVTLEDLLEVLVGEMVGEHEAVPVRSRKLSDGSYLVDATVRIDEFEELFGVTLPEGDYETLAGLFLSSVVRIPTPGEKLVVEGIRLEVIRAETHRIRTIKVTFPTDSNIKA